MKNIINRIRAEGLKHYQVRVWFRQACVKSYTSWAKSETECLAAAELKCGTSRHITIS